MRIRSPNRAPPVRFRVGSMLKTAMRWSVRSARNRRTSSSVSDDFPAPPVPVMPTTRLDDDGDESSSEAMSVGTSEGEAADASMMLMARANARRSPASIAALV